MYYFLLPFLVVVLFTGCSSSNSQRRQDLAQVVPYRPTAEVYEKLEKKRDLTLSDIKELSIKGVPEDLIIRHLQRSRAVYHLSTEQIDWLRKSGVSDSVIDFMLSTPRRYDRYGYDHPYYHDHFFFHHHHFWPHHGSGFWFGHHHWF